TQASTAVNPTVKSMVIVSGGSIASWSATLAAVTVSEHTSPSTKFVTGSIVNVVGPPEYVAGLGVALHLRSNHGSVTLTASLNVTVRLALTSTSVAPFTGNVETTVAAWSPLAWGSGTPAVKSAALSFVSVAPPPFRWTDVVFEGAAVGPVPSKQFAVVP